MSTGRDGPSLDLNAIVDWIALVLSVPLIWPKTTAAISVAVIAFCGYGVWKRLRPEQPPPPPPARILTQFRDELAAARQALESSYGPAGTSHGFLEAMISPDSAEVHDPTRCKKCFQPKAKHKQHDRAHAADASSPQR